MRSRPMCSENLKHTILFMFCYFGTDTTSVIFEAGDLTHASPSMVTKCAVVHCGKDVVSWKMIIDSWLYTARQRWVLSNSR